MTAEVNLPARSHPGRLARQNPVDALALLLERGEDAPAQLASVRQATSLRSLVGTNLDIATLDPTNETADMDATV